MKRFLKIRVRVFVFFLVESKYTPVDMRIGVARLDADHFGEIPRGAIVFLSFQISEPSIESRFRIFGIEADGFAIVLDRRFMLAQLCFG